MIIEISNFSGNRIDKKYFQKIGKVILKKLGQPKNMEIRTRSLRSRNLVSSLGSEISLVFVGDARMKGLNKKYRGIDKTTDVLSFAYQDVKIPPSPPFVKGGEKLLGEIVISVPQAKTQAKRRSYPLKAELTELFVHGILHLAGYDDETEREYERMTGKQEAILKHLGF